MYVIEKYTMGSDGVIQTYEEVFFTGKKAAAQSQFKAITTGDPTGVYTLEKVDIPIKRGKDAKTSFEEYLDSQGDEISYTGEIIDATENYPG